MPGLKYFIGRYFMRTNNYWVFALRVQLRHLLKAVINQAPSAFVLAERPMK
jgi:hypothetical protein